MALLKLNRNPTRSQLRQFAAIWLPACALIVAWIGLQYGLSLSVIATLLAVVAAACCVGYVVPDFIRPAFIAWLAVAYPVGWFISHLLLVAIYFAVLMPIGLIMRVMGVDPMQRTWDRQASTYWKRRRPTESVERYFRQY